MPRNNNVFEIYDALDRARANEKMEQMSSKLAIGIIVLLFPLALTFGVPVAAFFLLDLVLIVLGNAIGSIGLAIVVAVIIAIIFCAIDIFAIIYFYRKLKTGWKKWLIIAYMTILLAIPWLTGMHTFISWIGLSY